MRKRSKRKNRKDTNHVNVQRKNDFKMKRIGIAIRLPLLPNKIPKLMYY